MLIEATRAGWRGCSTAGPRTWRCWRVPRRASTSVPSGLDWRAGDEVVRTMMDHPTDVYAWLNLVIDRGVSVRFVKDRGGRYEAVDVEQLIGPRTRAVCLSLVNYGHGFRAPIEAISQICRRRGAWLVVDAIMALGALRVDAPAIGADIHFGAWLQFLLVRLHGVAICYCSARARRELVGRRSGLQGHGGGDGAVARRQPDFAAMAGRKPGIRDDGSTVRGGDASAGGDGGHAGDARSYAVGGRRGDRAPRVLGLAGQVVEGVLEKGYRVAGSTRPGERSAIVSFTREVGWTLPSSAGG